MAGITEQSMMRMGVGAAGETLLVLANGLPVNLRNPEVVEHYRQAVSGRLTLCEPPQFRPDSGDDLATMAKSVRLAFLF